MRLTNNEVTGIVEGIEKQSPLVTGELRLYGSRMDDNKKGGDIDLLLIVIGNELKQNLVANKHHILAQIKKNIGDRKIDLLICDSLAIEEDPFVGLIYPESLLLKNWLIQNV